jgi:hypothetical protein
VYDAILAPFVFFALAHTIGRGDDVRTSWSLR